MRFSSYTPMTLDVVSVHRKATFLILPCSSTRTHTDTRTHTSSAAASGFGFRLAPERPPCPPAEAHALLAFCAFSVFRKLRSGPLRSYGAKPRSPFPITRSAVRPRACLFICQRSRLWRLTVNNRSETRARVPFLKFWLLSAMNTKCWTSVNVGYVLKNEQVPFWFVFGLLLCFSSGKHVAHTYTQTKPHSCVEEVWLEHSFET